MIAEPGTRVEVVYSDLDYPLPAPRVQGVVAGVMLVPFAEGVHVWIDFDDGQTLHLLDGDR